MPEGILSPWHIAIVAVIALLVFGPKRLPELGSAVGKTIREFKQGLQEGETEMKEALVQYQAEREKASGPAVLAAEDGDPGETTT